MTRDDTNDALLLHALADDELDAATALALEQRLAIEPVLAADYERILAVKAATARLERQIVSDTFAARIAGLAPAHEFGPAIAAAPRRARGVDWRQMAASLVVTAGLASGLTYALVAPRATDPVETAIVSGHRRSLLAASPIDIASSDRHTVRPWFDAKLGLSPPAPDLASLGFPLVGGRVDVVADRPVPSLVYRHKEHLITVVGVPVSPGRDEAQTPIVSTAGGYNLVRWSQPGFRFWAVSDLDAGELGTFVEAMRSR